MTAKLVASLIYPDLCTFEFSCAAEVFALPRPELGEPLYEFAAFSLSPGPTTAMGGLQVQTSHNLR